MTKDHAGARVAVYGAGAWGTALAVVAAEAGHEVSLVGRDPAVAIDTADRRMSPKLPGVLLPETVRATADPGAVAAAEFVVLATPAQETRAAMTVLSPHLRPGAVVLSAAKGIDRATGQLVSEVIDGIWARGPIAVLSGPGFAGEIARGLPTAVTIAADDLVLAEALCRIFAAGGFRPMPPPIRSACSSAAR